MASRKKTWSIEEMRINMAHPRAMKSDEYGVQINVDVDAEPDRVIFRRITPDEADRIAGELHAQAARARQYTAKWRAK